MKKFAMETAVGIFVLIGLVSVSYMTIKLGNVSFLMEDAYSVQAKFTSVGGLRPGNPVQMYGIEIGRVEKVGVDQEDGLAVVVLKIQKGVTLYEDAMASIKTEGLIGDRYVNVDPGGAAEPLKHGGTIIETQSPVDLTELIGKYVFGGVQAPAGSRNPDNE
jgi:phospholipid/cholesterol/gamma-HCH transport system substrate-binding protein